MNVEYKSGDIVVDGVSCLNLDLTLDCGQAFRWVKNADSSWSGVAGGRYLNISGGDGRFVFKNTSPDDFNGFWRGYFDLDRDYGKICDSLKRDSLIAPTVDEYYGIRILNQDSWEALCSFVISQQNNIKRIKGIIDRLCRTYGNEIADGQYSFPSAERLSVLSADDFRALGTGYREEYLKRLCTGVADGSIDLDEIKKLPLDEARAKLMQIHGVGVKVANCALLFGFGFYDAFPVDTWMKRVMTYYPDGLPQCFDGIRGIAQQYLFHWARNNL